MKFRKTVEQDIDNIMNIIRQAQEFFKKSNIDQWQNNYPNKQTIKEDILNGYSYVLLKDENIVGTAAISFDGEKTYKNIYNGKWLSHGEYAVIHRLAVDSDYKGSGISSEIIRNVEKMCLDKGVKSIKVDTHEQNLPMQKLLQKNDFTYCGFIYLENKSKRVAFEKMI
jgi:RimJ/RimL family protein N-acetyltransferase